MKEWSSGASTVGMEGMHYNIRSGSRPISTVLMDASINALRRKISIDISIRFIEFYFLFIFF